MNDGKMHFATRVCLLVFAADLVLLAGYVKWNCGTQSRHGLDPLRARFWSCPNIELAEDLPVNANATSAFSQTTLTIDGSEPAPTPLDLERVCLPISYEPSLICLRRLRDLGRKIVDSEMVVPTHTTSVSVAFTTTQWIETFHSKSRTWVPITYTQTLASIPDQLPTAGSGSIGLGAATAMSDVMATGADEPRQRKSSGAERAVGDPAKELIWIKVTALVLDMMVFVWIM